MSQNDANGKAPTIDEQVAGFKAFATTDGEPSDGGDHPDETAAAEQRAEAARVAAAAEKATKAKTAPKPDISADSENAESSEDDEFGEGTEQTAAETAATKPAKKTAAERVKEINAATRELREVERRIAEREAAFEARLAAREGATKGSVAETPQGGVVGAGAPKPDDVDDKGNRLYEYGELDGRYITARAEYAAERRFKELKAEDAKRQEQTARTAEQAANRQKLQELTVKGAEKYDDFDEVVMQGAKAERYPVSEVVGRLILGSEVGADIAYHLASNPQEARQLAGKSPLEQAASFGRLEARFSAPASGATAAKVAKTTQAPPPIRSARGGGGSTGSPETSSDFAEFERAAMGSRK